MKCIYCEGKTQKAKVGYTVDRKGFHLYLASIPAYVCVKCKEKFFEEEEVKIIQRLINHIKSDVRQIEMEMV